MGKKMEDEDYGFAPPPDQAIEDPFLADLRAFKARKKPTPGFWPATKRQIAGGVSGLGRTLEDLGAEQIGGDLRRSGEEWQQEIGPSPVQSVGDFVRHPGQGVQEAVGGALGSMPVTAGGGALGYWAGMAAAPFLGPFAPIAPVAGAALGALGASFPAEYGEIRQGQEEHGTTDKGKAALGAGLASALDVVGVAPAGRLLPKGVLKDVVGGELKKGLTRGQVAKQMAGQTALAEAPTEAAQSIIEQQGYLKPEESYDWNDIFLSGILGGIGGGTLGGAAGMVHGGTGDKTDRPKNPTPMPKVFKADPLEGTEEAGLETYPETPSWMTPPSWVAPTVGATESPWDAAFKSKEYFLNLFGVKDHYNIPSLEKQLAGITPDPATGVAPIVAADIEDKYSKQAEKEGGFTVPEDRRKAILSELSTDTTEGLTDDEKKFKELALSRQQEFNANELAQDRRQVLESHLNEAKGIVESLNKLDEQRSHEQIDLANGEERKRQEKEYEAKKAAIEAKKNATPVESFDDPQMLITRLWEAFEQANQKRKQAEVEAAYAAQEAKKRAEADDAFKAIKKAERVRQAGPTKSEKGLKTVGGKQPVEPTQAGIIPTTTALPEEETPADWEAALGVEPKKERLSYGRMRPVGQQAAPVAEAPAPEVVTPPVAEAPATKPTLTLKGVKKKANPVAETPAVTESPTPEVVTPSAAEAPVKKSIESVKIRSDLKIADKNKVDLANGDTFKTAEFVGAEGLSYRRNINANTGETKLEVYERSTKETTPLGTFPTEQEANDFLLRHVSLIVNDRSGYSKSKETGAFTKLASDTNSGENLTEKMLGAGVRRETNQTLPPGVQGLASMGRHIEPLIRLAHGQEGTGVEAHEISHIADMLGLFSDQDHRIVNAALAKGQPQRRVLEDVLTREAIQQNMDPEDLLSELKYIEETRAYAFQMYYERKFKPYGKLGGVMARIKATIDRIVNWIKGNGFKNFEDVFKALEAGEYANAKPRFDAKKKSEIQERPTLLKSTSLSEALEKSKKAGANSVEQFFDSNRKLALKLYTLPQIADSYWNLFSREYLPVAIRQSGWKELWQGLVKDTDKSLLHALVRNIKEKEKEFNYLKTVADRVTAEWARYDDKTARAIGDLCLGHTFNQVDPWLTVEEASQEYMKNGKVTVRFDKYLELRGQYLRLQKNNPEAIQTFHKVLKSLQTDYQTLREEIMRIVGKTSDESLKKRIQALLPDYLPHYFPLGRYGDYVLVATKPVKNEDGILVDHKFVSRHETIEARALKADELEKNGYTIQLLSKMADVYDVAEGKQNAAVMRELDKKIDEYYGKSNDPAQVELGKQLSELVKEVRLDILSRESMFAGAHKRKFIDGYSKDAMRAYENQSISMAWRIASIKHDYNVKMILDFVRWFSKNLSTPRMAQEVKAAQQHHGLKPLPENFGDVAADVYSALASNIYAKEGNKNNPVTRFLKNSAFLNYMLTPSMMVINGTQVPIVGVARLAALYGGNTEAWKKASKAYWQAFRAYRVLFKARMDATKSSNPLKRFGLNSTWWDIKVGIDALEKINPEWKRIVEDAIDAQIVDRTLAADIGSRHAFSRAFEDNPSPFSNLTNKTKVAGNAVMKYSTIFAHESEAMNRIVSIIMGYEYGKQKAQAEGLKGFGKHMVEDENGHKVPDDEPGYARAKQLAYEFNEFTNLNYDRAIRPQMFTGPVAEVITQFRMFEQGMIYNLLASAHRGFMDENLSEADRKIHKDTVKALLFSYGLHAGAFGLPFAGGVFALLSLAWGDDDDPDDLKADIANSMAEVIGPEATEVLLHGVWRGLPLPDFSSRIGADNWLFRTSLIGPQDRESTMAWLADMWGGPALSMIGNISEGMNQIEGGNTERGIETMSPKMVRDFLRSYRYATEDMKNLAGYSEGVDLGVTDAAYQAFGFTPEPVAVHNEAKHFIMERKTALETRRKTLRNMWVWATEAGDADRQGAVQELIDGFNEANPKLALTPEKLRATLESRRKMAPEYFMGVRIQKGMEDVKRQGDYAR